MIRKILLCAVVLFSLCGCEELKRNGRPGDPGYIAPKYLTVTVIDFEPEFIGNAGGRAVTRNAYSVVEDEHGKRYRVGGKVGPVGDTFKMDVSLLDEIGI